MVLYNKTGELAQLKFVGKISDMGDRKIIYIPKSFHKQVRVLVDDEI